MRFELKDACIRQVQEKIDNVNQEINALKQDLGNETKSTAGDKYETGRAMIHLELEKRTSQYHQLKMNFETLRKLPEKESESIGLGSVVKTSNGNLYISVGLGKIKVNQEWYYCVSPSSPIACAINGKKEGDVVAFNQQQIRILKIH